MEVNSEFSKLKVSDAPPGNERLRTRSSSFFLPDPEEEEIQSPRIDPSYQPKVLKSEGTKLKQSEYKLSNESKVLVLYTGGTIGMRIHKGVYSPEPNFLVNELRKIPMFHDEAHIMRHHVNHTTSQSCNIPLCMPMSKESKHVVYCVYEYEPLLDSSNMTMDDWKRIANDIKYSYEHFDGFVILHGTDTMSYTASALSFMLENLGKPVILTGSQIPIFETRSDGRDNFLGALIIAAHYCIPEVCLFFNNKLLRGNRSIKKDSASFDAFDSPNLPPLVRMEIDVHVDWEAVFTSNTTEKFKVNQNLCPNVGLLRLFPSITTETVRAFCQPPMQGVVLQTYGSGNAPDARKDLMAVFKEATDRGVIIVNITQCQRGNVVASYATGQAPVEAGDLPWSDMTAEAALTELDYWLYKSLVEAGVLPGSDMTAEAALTKLAYVLGKEDWDITYKRRMMAKNLRGEMKVKIASEISLSDFTLIETIAQTMHLSSKEEIQSLRDALFPALSCAAALKGDVPALEKIRMSGGHLTLPDYDGRTSLHVAAGEGHFATVQYLLQNGASVHVRDKFGKNALMDAVRYKQYDIIRLLIQTGAHLMITPQKLGTELCMIASHGPGAVDDMKAWCMAGADLNQGDYDNRTALHVAVCHGHEDVVKFLLEHNVKADVVDNFQRTPLQEAEVRKYTKIAHHLREYLKETKKKNIFQF